MSELIRYISGISCVLLFLALFFACPVAAEEANGIWIVNSEPLIYVQERISTTFPAATVVTGSVPRIVSALSPDEVTWTSSDESVGDFSSTGVFYAKKPGTTTITASWEGWTDSETVEVGSSPIQADRAEVYLKNSEMYVEETQHFIVIAYDSHTGKRISDLLFDWTATGGTITNGDYTAGKTTGTYTVTASSSSLSATGTVTVKAPAVTRIEISSPGKVGQGASFVVTATAYNGDEIVPKPGITWVVGDTSIISVDDEDTGRFTAEKPGSTTLQAKAADGTGSEVVAITVEETGSTPVYRISTGSAAAGTAASLSAVHTGGDTADAFTWKFTSPSGAVFTQTTSSPSTSYTFPSAGTYTVTLAATNTNNDRTGEVSASVSVYSGGGSSPGGGSSSGSHITTNSDDTSGTAATPTVTSTVSATVGRMVSPTASSVSGTSSPAGSSGPASGTASSGFICCENCPCLLCWLMLVLGCILGSVVTFVAVVLLIRRQRKSDGWA